MNLRRLDADLRRHEGYRSKPYRDSRGIWTIGIGINLEQLDADDLQMLYESRRSKAISGAIACCPSFHDLDDVRQEVLVNMAYNLGARGLAHFRKMLDAIDRLDFDAAANEMLHSVWADQVGKRATELAAWMRYGSVGGTQV